MNFKVQDDGSGLAELRIVIEDEDERYPKVVWVEGLSGNKARGEIDWDGRFKGGLPALPGGEYYAVLKVSDQAGNERMQSGQIFVEAASPPAGAQPDGRVAEIENDELTPALQPEKTQFSVGGTRTAPAARVTSNLLWGATATAAVGAFMAEIARRKREEAAARKAAAVRREARASSNYRQKRRAEKLGMLAAQWAKERAQKLNASRQAVYERVLDVKEKLLTPKVPPKPKYAAPNMSWKRDDVRRAEEYEAQKPKYAAPDMGWKKE